MSPHPSCGDCPLTARSRPKRAATISRKIVGGQQYLSGWVETLTELPFIGDQGVCLSHDQVARSLLSTQGWACALATAARPDNRDEFAGPNTEVELTEDL